MRIEILSEMSVKQKKNIFLASFGSTLWATYIQLIGCVHKFTSVLIWKPQIYVIYKITVTLAAGTACWQHDDTCLTPFSTVTQVSRYQNVSTGAKDDGDGGDDWSYKTNSVGALKGVRNRIGRCRRKRPVTVENHEQSTSVRRIVAKK